MPKSIINRPISRKRRHAMDFRCTNKHLAVFEVWQRDTASGRRIRHGK